MALRAYNMHRGPWRGPVRLPGPRRATPSTTAATTGVTAAPVATLLTSDGSVGPAIAAALARLPAARVPVSHAGKSHALHQTAGTGKHRNYRPLCVVSLVHNTPGAAALRSMGCGASASKAKPRTRNREKANQSPTTPTGVPAST